MALKVIGAGFGRTGTLSLKTALEELGFGRCYHMKEVLQNPSHWRRWAEIIDGGKADWDTLFNGYQSSSDWPVAAYYKELMQIYPDAKIILTIRDPEGWYKSIMGTLYQFGRQYGPATRILPSAHRLFHAMEKVIWSGIFQDKLEDKAHALKVFNEHIEEVKRVVPKERLLIFEASQGWEPLCAFLNVPVPAHKPYPHRHKGALIRKVLKYRMVLKWSALILVMMLLYELVDAFVV